MFLMPVVCLHSAKAKMGIEVQGHLLLSSLRSYLSKRMTVMMPRSGLLSSVSQMFRLSVSPFSHLAPHHLV